MLHHRLGHYALLLLLGSLLVFPNLGTTSLWDDDEGVNSECTREMMETGTVIVPLFNWDLRTQKPIMLYWVMRLSFQQFGVNEWAARFPSAIAFLFTILLTYELARRMFDALTGLTAGIIVATCLELNKLGHAATPDSVLIAFFSLYFWAFWVGSEPNRRHWFIPCGIASALAMLTKGPIGFVFPSAILAGYWLWNRELYRFWDRRLIWGTVVWVLVAIPWYALVTAETKGQWTLAFFLKENIGRSAEPMENHSGPPVYYFIAVCLFFAPWSSFLIVTCWHTIKKARHQGAFWAKSDQAESRAYRFLLVWILVFFTAFTIVRTKLPHYVAPAYPPLAILFARFLVLWCQRLVTPPRWAIPAGILGTFLTGLVVLTLFLLGPDYLPQQTPPEAVQTMSALKSWCWVGLLPIFGSIGMAWGYWYDQRRIFWQSLCISTVMFVGFVFAFPLRIVDQGKSMKDLVQMSGAKQPTVEMRIASYQYTQPSLTFYVERRVERLQSAEQVVAFLQMPVRSLLFVPERFWQEEIESKFKMPYTILAQKYDVFRNSMIFVVGNFEQ